MVEIGTLSVVGEYQGENLDIALNRVSSNMQDVEQQSNQTNASLSRGSAIAGTFGKALIGLGATGLSAITALAIKSPVLAGTMAKIEVETLKLSNTVGRQLRPVFEAIAGDLLPSINQAFIDNQDEIGKSVVKVEALVGAVSDLIALDWSGLGKNMETVFTSDLPNINQAEKETAQSTLGDFAESGVIMADLIKSFGKLPTGVMDFITGESGTAYGLGGAGRTLTESSTLFYQIIIDAFQSLFGENDQKEQVLTNSTGVTR